jgi:hypothetical protein
MGERKRTDDLADLTVAATRALHKALSDGDGHHEPGSWAAETTGNQINHLIDHLKRVQAGELTKEHLTHIVCRATILYALSGCDCE